MTDKLEQLIAAADDYYAATFEGKPSDGSEKERFAHAVHEYREDARIAAYEAERDDTITNLDGPYHYGLGGPV